MHTFSVRLKESRERCNLTQGDIAKKLKIKRSTYSNYESKDEKEPSYEMMAKICSILNVTSDYLLGLSERPDNKVEVFPNDCVNFKITYEKMPRSLRPNVDPIFDSIYRIILPDMRKCNSERIDLYADLFRKISSLRYEIKSRIEASGGATRNAAELSELMSLQSELKNTTSALLDELMQADMRIAFGSKKQHYRESPESSAI